jgi:hypothetical protein
MFNEKALRKSNVTGQKVWPEDDSTAMGIAIKARDGPASIWSEGAADVRDGISIENAITIDLEARVIDAGLRSGTGDGNCCVSSETDVDAPGIRTEVTGGWDC